MAGIFTASSNKRKGPDLILRIVDRASLVLWSILIVNMGMILSAKPQWETFFDRLLNISIPQTWNYKLLRLSLFVSAAQFVISLFYLYLNSKRLKRKGDKIRISIIISLFLSLAVCIYLAYIVFVEA